MPISDSSAHEEALTGMVVGHWEVHVIKIMYPSSGLIHLCLCENHNTSHVCTVHTVKQCRFPFISLFVFQNGFLFCPCTYVVKKSNFWHTYSQHYAENVISLACFEMQKKYCRRKKVCFNKL